MSACRIANGVTPRGNYVRFCTDETYALAPQVPAMAEEGLSRSHIKLTLQY